MSKTARKILRRQLKNMHYEVLKSFRGKWQRVYFPSFKQPFKGGLTYGTASQVQEEKASS